MFCEGLMKARIENKGKDGAGLEAREERSM
jgi:hypothetical protein